MKLVWEIKNFDWYSITNDANYIKQQKLKMEEIINSIKISTDINSLRQSLTFIPKDTGSIIRSELVSRITELGK